MFQAVIASVALIAGLGIRVLFPVLPTPDLASSILALQVLTPLAGSLLLIGALSAIMSTCDSIMIISAAGISHDLYGKYLRPDATEPEKLRVNRWSVLIVGSIPLGLTFVDLGLVQEIVVDYAKIIASFFFVPVLLGLNWRRGTRAGAIASMLGGFTAFMTWWWQGPDYPFGIDPIFPGVLVSLALFVGVSLLTRPAPREALDLFFDDPSPNEPGSIG